MIVFLLSASIFGCATNNRVYEINGKFFTCGGVENLSSQGPEYFKSWSNNDFKAADGFIKSCRTPFNGSVIDPAIANISKASSDRARESEELRAKRNEDRIRAAECMESREYRLYSAEKSVAMNWNAISQLTQQQDKQKEYARVSGVRDLEAERIIGVRLVDARSRLVSSYDDYRKAGGKSAPHEVSQTRNNPCRAN